ncbi:unnamed protein product, partial [marine sediment metagenome]
MKCPFKTPAKYEMKITTTEYIVIDAEKKVIAKCSYEDDALFIQNIINGHKKLVEACKEGLAECQRSMHLKNTDLVG